MERVAVIGAGAAGLAAAAHLSREGLAVTVLEASDGPGGRLAGRRFDGGQVDLGAQFVTARDPAFQEAVQQAVFAGCATGWAPRGRDTDEPWIVGLPAMADLLEPLARDLAFVPRCRIERIGSTTEGYLLQSQAGNHGPFDTVVVAVPAPLAAALLTAHGKPFDAIAAAVMRPALTAAFAFARRLDCDRDYLAGGDGIDVAIRCSSKPGRQGESWVVHGDRAWSEAHAEDDEETIAADLLQRFAGLAGAAIPEPSWRATMIWPHAFVDRPLGAPCLAAPNGRIAAAGDWCLGPRVECAFLSGRAAAEAVLGR